MKNIASRIKLNRTGARVKSPSSGVRPGARALNLELPTSFGFRLFMGALCLLAGSLLFTDSAHAAFSASISRSGTISIAEPGSSTIRPTSTGTLGTGSDVVTVITNCAYGGYKLYVSATSTGGTALKLSGNSDSIPTSSTAVGSETTLSRDTWGVGKTASAFSGLQAYADDIGMLTPFYTGVTSDSYTFYYGVNVSTAKTPGTYTGEVLYTVLMDEACTKYTLNFDGNNATTNTLAPQDLDFDSTINLADISSTSKITRTGYTLAGWKDQSGNSYGITGTADINPNDLASVTLTAQWAPNTYTITYNANSGTGTTEEQKITYDNGDITLRASNFTYSGYDFQGWSKTSGIDNTVDYKANTDYSINTIVSDAGVTDNNGATITLYAVWKKSIVYMQGWTGCSGLSKNEYLTLRDSRDDNNYVVKKLADGKCWMVQNLRLTNYKLTSADSNVASDFDLTAGVTYSGPLGWCTTSSSACDDVKAAYYNSSEASDNSKSSYYGALYNWYTATAGTGKYATSSSNVSSDICPKGWRLPTGGAGGEFVALDKAWGGTGSNRDNANTYSTFTNTYLNGIDGGFNLAGNIRDSVVGVSEAGAYWSSAASTANGALYLYLNQSTAVLPQGDNYKYLGFSVRCLAKS